MNGAIMFCRGFEDGLCAKQPISRIEAYDRLPVEWHEYVDEYLNGHDDGVARDWYRYTLLTTGEAWGPESLSTRQEV